MYVEISGRQTGKTTRLIEDAAEQLICNLGTTNDNYKIAVISPTLQNSNRIKNQIINKFTEKATLCGIRYYSNAELDNKINVFTNMINTDYHRIDKFYIDEFSFIDGLYFSDNAYYTTTPNTSGTDKFMEILLTNCEWMGIPIVSYDISQELRTLFYMTDRRYIQEFDNWCVENGLQMLTHPFENTKKNIFVKLSEIKKHRL